ncbi:hypothetical protein, partial [Bradyrhizobium iriomotense]|uniref:hypothetical protein n=1 Tax=Bradyrhizobium iriomotense TaxID=441950 RepID=UPI001FE9D16C
MTRDNTGFAIVRPVGVEENQRRHGLHAGAVAMQLLMATVLQRLAAPDLGEEERTAQHARARRQQQRQATGSLHRRIEIDESMAPAGAAGRGPLIACPQARIEGRAQAIAPRRGDRAAQQEIAVMVEGGRLLSLEGRDLSGRRFTAHAATHHLRMRDASTPARSNRQRTCLVRIGFKEEGLAKAGDRRLHGWLFDDALIHLFCPTRLGKNWWFGCSGWNEPADCEARPDI